MKEKEEMEKLLGMGANAGVAATAHEMIDEGQKTQSLRNSFD
jgi:hypothetical protein